MLYDLRRADPRVKWLVTCLLATFGLSYLFGSWMVGLFSGFTPHAIVVTYASPEMSMPMPPMSTMMQEHPMHMQEFAAAEPHTIDRDLLVQDTHVHVPMYGMIAAALSLVVLGLEMAPGWGYALITLLFDAPWMSFAGMWITKLVSPGFGSVLTLASGYAMGLGFTIVAGVAMWQMWRPAPGGVQ
jgi:hypothetical protein